MHDSNLQNKTIRLNDFKVELEGEKLLQSYDGLNFIFFCFFPSFYLLSHQKLRKLLVLVIAWL